MTSIVKAKAEDFELLADIGKRSFVESHGSSATPENIMAYVNKKYTDAVFMEELSNPENIYHIIYHDGQAAGYSKIIFNALHSNLQATSATKLERLYLLKEFYDLNLGYGLFKYNVELSQKAGQEGMWLFVWKENHRAVNFYMKTGFEIIGSHDFKLTDTHSNPNHQMFFKY